MANLSQSYVTSAHHVLSPAHLAAIWLPSTLADRSHLHGRPHWNWTSRKGDQYNQLSGPSKTTHHPHQAINTCITSVKRCDTDAIPMRCIA
ncbi:hypothetical protein PGTUg99_018040 [Puccinia graminis f. sp. tritici]|uniref:Uncharacterized protein n=1 Tax=Puccinia graminis f. sp. tritici TaxID=56615 RepID=A0A5B0LMV4_PUCGR|nr:hypothetical protein PGTUg99_018040 [Puccinia graminis f. sp. tritici]